MANSIIEVDNISKAYRIGMRDIENDSLGRSMLQWAKAPLRNYRRLRNLSHFDLSKEEKDVLWAIRNVSFNVTEGEVLGIVGKNGAGKSTLLKILSQVTPPTLGQITMRGRVASLLEVGTGFNPELTGRENVYLNGTILGMRKTEVDAKFDEIIDFSGVAKFIDTPVKRYSSGMKVRLAFAVAAHLDPEILIIDEVLAVGDAEFQQRCLGKMRDVADGGRTVLFVSHNMNAVNRLCSRAIMLKSGQIAMEGDTNTVVTQYIKGLTEAEGFTTQLIPQRNQSDKHVQLLEARIQDGSGNISDGSIDFNEDIVLNLRFKVTKTVRRLLLGYTLKNGNDEDILLGYSSDDPDTSLKEYPAGEYQVALTINQPLLKPDYYHIDLGFVNQDEGNSNVFHTALDFEVINLSNQIPRKMGALYIPMAWNIERTSL